MPRIRMSSLPRDAYIFLICFLWSASTVLPSPMLSFLPLLLLFIHGGIASPTEALAPRSAPSNTVRIRSASDYCMIVPKTPHTRIGDSEHPGGTTSYCSKPGSGQGHMPPNFWTHVHYKTGKGKRGKSYVQLTGCINPGSLDRLVANDDGGQYDSSGGQGGRGNPAGSSCEGYAHYVELIEPSGHVACIRCCQDAADCPTNRDTQGCGAVIPGPYGC